MWARIIEFTLGVWLGISWIIFQYNSHESLLIINDLLCFGLISCFSLLSYIEKLRHIHLLNFLMAIFLIVLAYGLRSHALEIYSNNYMCVALLLLLLTIIPTNCNNPPYQWIKYMTMSKNLD